LKIAKVTFVLGLLFTIMIVYNNDEKISLTAKQNIIVEFEDIYGLDFSNISGAGIITNSKMGVSDITNQQYANFLTAAFSQAQITYNSSEKTVCSMDSNLMINLGGVRVTKDQNNDGVYTLDEMENPLNRCLIEFNDQTNEFFVLDPAAINWSQYFDRSVYPNVVDTIDDWAELNSVRSGFYEASDINKRMPTLDEVKSWPVNHMMHYGAKKFMIFYGFDLPVKVQ